jgi:hypothetical protein
MGGAIGRNVRSPACFAYYENDVNVQLKTDTPAIWVQRCNSALGSGYDHKGDEIKLHTVSMTMPMDFLFPDRIQSATLTVVGGNLYTWSYSLCGAGGVSERLPPTTSIRASMRVTF